MYRFRVRGSTTFSYSKWGRIKLLKTKWKVLPSNWPKMRLNAFAFVTLYVTGDNETAPRSLTRVHHDHGEMWVVR